MTIHLPENLESSILAAVHRSLHKPSRNRSARIVLPKTFLTKIAPYKENPARWALSRSKGVIRAKRKVPASGDQRHNYHANLEAEARVSAVKADVPVLSCLFGHP